MSILSELISDVTRYDTCYDTWKGTTDPRPQMIVFHSQSFAYPEGDIHNRLGPVHTTGKLRSGHNPHIRS
jgi:hypothetical protein